MIGNLDGSAGLFLANLERIQQTMERAQNQMSSGRKVNSVADAPEEVSGILQLQTQIDLNTAVQGQLQNTKAIVDTAEGAVQSGVQLMDQAVSLADQAASTLQTPESRQTIAQEIQGILEQMVSLSRSSVANRYVFSGDADQVPCYEADPGSSTGVKRLLAPQSSMQIGDTDGFAFAFSRTAQEIFDHRNTDDSAASDNVFAALNSLRVALEQNDSTAIQASASTLRKAGDYLNGQLGFYGAVQNRLGSAINIAKKFQVQQQAGLSGMQDADVAALALELSQAQIHQQAALAARAAALWDSCSC